jgi:hypothetical protein
MDMLGETGILRRHFRSGVKLQGRSKPRMKAVPVKGKGAESAVVVTGRAARLDMGISTVNRKEVMKGG